ncbi:hypothetical protein ACTJI8_12945 [Microbacterium sp. 22303]|uniref:hypothetical protein n=1 Tax=Microbacterium sp. 22303 TaxID=3453905 RepID=UPI003F8506D3
MTARMGADNRARLTCDHDGCLRIFGRNHTSARATRDAATKAGWKTAERDQRQDFCAEHAGVN